MSYFLVSIVNGSLNSLNLIEDFDTLCLVVLNAPLYLLKVSIQIVNYLVLIADSVFMVALARAYFIFEATNFSLKISDNFLKNFEITLTSLVIFYFLFISGDNTIADIVWA